MKKVRTPLFPVYSEVAHLLPIWSHYTQTAVRSMITAIRDQTGTPQDPVDWSDPDTWIAERLKGLDAEIADRVWRETGGAVNPRHTYGSYLFINSYGLLEPDATDQYHLTEAGRRFLEGDPELLREIDEAEGIPELLGILTTKARARRGDILPEWGRFLRQHSTYGTPSTIKSTLRHRLMNVIERGFVEREGNLYEITDAGVEYAAEVMPSEQEQRDVARAVAAHNEQQKGKLKDRLGEMDPFAFEQLVRDLLEAMGYEDVTVTKQSGDKGVDVVATVQFGITTVTEVVQVKRHQANIRRPVIDQLRGVLPFHNAIRGTIITISGFSRGCTEVATFTGAAPITLIDGDKLVEMLVENEIGVTVRQLSVFDLDDSIFTAADDEIDDAAELA